MSDFIYFSCCTKLLGTIPPPNPPPTPPIINSTQITTIHDELQLQLNSILYPIRAALFFSHHMDEEQAGAGANSISLLSGPNLEPVQGPPGSTKKEPPSKTSPHIPVPISPDNITDQAVDSGSDDIRELPNSSVNGGG